VAPRVLNDYPELRAVRDGFKLANFYKGTGEERRHIWFRALDHVWGMRHLLYEGEDPPPDVLLELLASSLRKDEPLAAWMKDKERTNLEWRGDPDNWRLVERALAGVIVQDYLAACEDGRWTRTTDD
jgi:hypothetical protein